jgi:hypothetical protein
LGFRIIEQELHGFFSNQWMSMILLKGWWILLGIWRIRSQLELLTSLGEKMWEALKPWGFLPTTNVGWAKENRDSINTNVALTYTNGCSTDDVSTSPSLLSL